MPVSYYPKVQINYDKEMVTIRNSKEIEFPLTVKELAAIVGEEEFWIVTCEDGFFGETTYLKWITQRPETDEEQKARIEADEAYNRKCDEKHAELKRREERIKQEKEN